MSTRVKSSNGNRPNTRGNSNQREKGTQGIRESVNSTHQEKRKIIGQYMIGKTIGEGTFGKVKLAVHIPTGEKVAIKILEKNRIKDQADVRRVNREIKILKKSRHNNIIQLYEVLDTQNTIYLIMECAEGGEMFDYIVAQKHVAEIQACKFFHQIIDGVEVLHNNDITHRDLKPENLLLKASSSGWLIKIVDFGLSNTHEGGKLLSTACGSPCYAAPEMIAGKKYHGPLADIWSLGVILFALVGGFLPFEDPNTAQLYKKILSGDYHPPKWISAEVKDLIRKILETDPNKRFQINDIRKHAWYNIVSEDEIPREIISEKDCEITKNEVMRAISTAGLDSQAVLDGIASHACNSNTAMYYLLEQKYKALRLKLSSSHQNQPSIQPTESNISNTSHKTTNSQPESVSDTGTGQAKQQLNQSVISAKSHAKPSNNVVTPYLQTPSILHQQQNQQSSLQAQQYIKLNNVSSVNYNSSLPNQTVMPTLDNYLQTNNANVNINQNNNTIAGTIKLPPTKTIEVPKLNLVARTNANGTVNSVMISQSARMPEPTSYLQSVTVNSSVKGESLTSRPHSKPIVSVSTAGPDVLSMHPLAAELLNMNMNIADGEERPNTRRSHTRGSSRQSSRQGTGAQALIQLEASGPLLFEQPFESIEIEKPTDSTSQPVEEQQNMPTIIGSPSKMKEIKTGSGLPIVASGAISSNSNSPNPQKIESRKLIAPQAPSLPATKRSVVGGRSGRNIHPVNEELSQDNGVNTNDTDNFQYVNSADVESNVNATNKNGSVTILSALQVDQLELNKSPRGQALRNKAVAQLGSLGASGLGMVTA
eukprot:gene12421-16659_t